jgi:hypothetical protein
MRAACCGRLNFHGGNTMTNNAPRDDRFARESFTWRRMTQWQLWGVSLFGIAVLIGLVLYSTSM